MGSTQTTPANVSHIPPGCELKDASVNLMGVDGALLTYAGKLGMVHLHAFDKPAVITSGKDSVHGTGSKHYTGKAIDVRLGDLDKNQRTLFLGFAYEIADLYKVSLMAERDAANVEHLHVELAG